MFDTDDDVLPEGYGEVDNIVRLSPDGRTGARTHATAPAHGASGQQAIPGPVITSTPPDTPDADDYDGLREGQVLKAGDKGPLVQKAQRRILRGFQQLGVKPPPLEVNGVFDFNTALAWRQVVEQASADLNPAQIDADGWAFLRDSWGPTGFQNIVAGARKGAADVVAAFVPSQASRPPQPVSDETAAARDAYQANLRRAVYYGGGALISLGVLAGLGYYFYKRNQRKGDFR